MLRVSGKRISSFLWRRNQAALAVLSRDLINGDVASGAYGAIYHPLRLTSRLAFRDVIRDTNSRHPFAMGMGAVRSFSEDATHVPVITDPDIQNAFKDLMAANWDELPNAVIHDAKNSLSKHTEDKAGPEALANVLRAAEAVEEFGGVLVSLRMAIDDSIGMSGEDVGPLPEEFVKALQVAFQRYTTYLDAFGPHEAYLRKKSRDRIGYEDDTLKDEMQWYWF